MGATWVSRLEKLSHRLLGAHVGLGASPTRRTVHGWHPDLDQPVRSATFVVFDVETTGLRPGRDRIVSLGAVRFTNGPAVAEEAIFTLRAFIGNAVPVVHHAEFDLALQGV